MKIVSLLLLLFVFCSACASATMQEPDLIVYGSQKGELETSFSYPSPFETYYSNHYPFTALSTANYRGHIATFEVKDGKLYLIEVKVENAEIPLDWLFAVPPNVPRVQATWFTGMLLGHFGSYREWHNNPNYPGNFYVEKFAAGVIFDIENGQVLSETVLTDDEFRQAAASKTKDGVQITPEQKAAVDKYYDYLDSIEYTTTKSQPTKQEPPPSTTPLGKLLEIVAKRPTVKQADEREIVGWQMCRDLKGFDGLRKDFIVEAAGVGYINSFPLSLQVDLLTNSQGLINSVWWWNPVIDNRAQYDWNDFLKLYTDASSVLSKHTWIKEWLDFSPGRKVELHAFGNQIGETETELKDFVLPVWQQAGFVGEPAYSILLRANDRVWAQLYFGKDDPRALVTNAGTGFFTFASFFEEEDTPTPTAAQHWLENLDVSFHPRCKPGERSERYVVIEPSGAHEVKTFMGCKR